MKNIYKRYRFPLSVPQHAVWLTYRFNLSVWNVKDLLAERGVRQDQRQTALRTEK